MTARNSPSDFRKAAGWKMGFSPRGLFTAAMWVGHALRIYIAAHSTLSRTEDMRKRRHGALPGLHIWTKSPKRLICWRRTFALIQPPAMCRTPCTGWSGRMNAREIRRAREISFSRTLRDFLLLILAREWLTGCVLRPTESDLR